MNFKVQPAPPALFDVPYKVGDNYFLQSHLCIPEYYVSRVVEGQDSEAPLHYSYVFTRCSNVKPYLYRYEIKKGASDG